MTAGGTTSPAYSSTATPAWISVQTNVTVAANQKIMFTVNAALGAAGAAATGLRIWPCYSTGGVPTELSAGMFDFTAAAGARESFGVSGITPALAAGTYIVGMCGYTTQNPSQWTNGEWSYVSAIVFN
jgi:hypothetical protein